LLQGPSIPIVARWLGLDSPEQPRRGYPIEPSPAGGFARRLRELSIPPESPFVGKRIVELGLPPEFLVILIDRPGGFEIASGATEIQAGDKLLVISGDAAYHLVKNQAEALSTATA
jgi:cell volume regulation protein A